MNDHKVSVENFIGEIRDLAVRHYSDDVDSRADVVRSILAIVAETAALARTWIADDLDPCHFCGGVDDHVDGCDEVA